MERAETSAAVGGEIDAWCTRCKMLLNHRVIAKVAGVVKRVQCLTCEGQHAFRPAASTHHKAGPAPTEKAPPKKRAKKGPVDDGRPGSPYVVASSFRATDVLLHPTYGRGIVVLVRGDKIDVDFAGALRTLVHGRSTPPA